MAPNPNGMRGHAAGERTNLYALVIYLPDPLGSFLDDLRLEMVPGCNPHAHVSVLPPRPLPAPPDAAIHEAKQVVSQFPSFDIALGQIEIFAQTDVIYISVDGGADRLREMHRTLNRGALAFQEPFEYHPHVTLGQELDPSQVSGFLELANQRWSEFKGPRRFRVEHTMFVQNTDGKRWIDLAEGPLNAAATR